MTLNTGVSIMKVAAIKLGRRAFATVGVDRVYVGTYRSPVNEDHCSLAYTLL
jgi:hypothetical protein